MYKVIINYNVTEATKNHYAPYKSKIIVADDAELRALVTLAPEADYEINSVKKIYREEIQSPAKDFIEEIKNKIKPKNLIYGVNTKNLSPNYKKDLDKKLKEKK